MEEVKLTKQEIKALREAEIAKKLTAAKRADLDKAVSARHFPPKDR
jgi:hypothetical protein